MTIRRILAEFLGTGLLTAVVVGSGIMAARLSPADTGLRLLQNSFATMLALAVLIAVLSPVSGAHFNPVVSVAHWWLGRRHGSGISGRDLIGYVAAQCAGGIIGAMLANAMFELPTASWSRTVRGGEGLWFGEVVATAGLVLVIFALARSARATAIPVAVGAWIGAAHWFTSSTSFANPAVTLGRAFSDTFAGIAPASVPAFVAAQIVGGGVGVALVTALHPIKRSVDTNRKAQHDHIPS